MAGKPGKKDITNELLSLSFFLPRLCSRFPNGATCGGNLNKRINNPYYVLANIFELLIFIDIMSFTSAFRHVSAGFGVVFRAWKAQKFSAHIAGRSRHAWRR